MVTFDKAKGKVCYQYGKDSSHYIFCKYISSPDFSVFDHKVSL